MKQKMYPLRLTLALLALPMNYIYGTETKTIPKLEQICRDTILACHIDYSELAECIAQPIADQQKRLDLELVRLCHLTFSEPAQINQLLSHGADPNIESLHDLLLESPLETVTIRASNNNYDYNRLYGDGTRREVLIAKLLIQYGAKFTPRCLFCAVSSENKEMVELLHKNYFPDYKEEWHRNADGTWRCASVLQNTNAWLELTEAGKNIFHCAALFAFDNDFTKWLFKTYGKRKFLYARNQNGKTPLDILSNRGPQAKRIADECASCISFGLFPGTYEHATNKATQTLQWLQRTELGDTVRHNWHQLFR
ncbi:MAG: hypothetical protein H6679_02520 [Epsilonproteobacteria bacterium]|nr:hypothetical protein [Campylobacterota bacterium]